MVEPTDRDKDEQDRLAQEEAIRDLDLDQEPAQTFKMETTDFGEPTSAQETTAGRPIDGQPVTDTPEAVAPIEAAASGPIEKRTDLQAEQIHQQEQGLHGNQAGTIASATKQVIQEEEAKERAHTAKNAAMAATITAAAATVAQTQKMLEEMAIEQKEIDAQLADIEDDSFFFEFETEEIIDELDTIIDDLEEHPPESPELVELRLDMATNKAQPNIDEIQKLTEQKNNPEAQTNYAESLTNTKSALEDLLDNVTTQKDELVAQKEATDQKLQPLLAIEKPTEAEQKAILELKQELQNIDKGIAQYDQQKEQLTETAALVKDTNAPDSTLSMQQKTQLNNATCAAMSFSKDGVLSQAEQKELQEQMKGVDVSGPHAKRYANLIANSGVKVETPDGRTLQGKEAADYMMAGAEKQQPEITKPDAAETIAAAGAGKVSGETAVGDKADEWSGTDSMKLETSEEYQTAIADVHSRIESGEITREELDQMLAKSDASPELKSQIEKALEREGVNIVEPENTNTPGIKGLAANELGEENAEIAADVTKTATLTAAPTLALLGGQSIKQNIEVQGAPTKVASGINNSGQSFADSDAFKMYNQEGVTASYDEPVNNKAEFAPNDLGETMYAAATNKDDGTGSGSGGGATLDQEEALKQAAQQAELARLHMAQQNEMSRPDLDAPENKMV